MNRLFRALGAFAFAAAAASFVFAATDKKPMSDSDMSSDSQHMSSDSQMSHDDMAMPSENTPLYSVQCDPSCSFMVRSHDKQEVVAIVTEHVKRHHNMNPSAKEVESWVKTTKPTD